MTSRFFTTASVPTMRATPRNRKITWPSEASGCRRVTKVMPMPESVNTMGRIAGSAPGAKMRTPIWAAANAANSPSGTASVWKESAAPVVTTYMA